MGGYMIQGAYHGAASWNAHVISSLVISSFSKADFIEL
jgi:hypothetical protein